MNDGIIDQTIWENSKVKIIFILKEPGAEDDDASLQDLFIKKWNRKAKHSFINLGRWAYAIQEGGASLEDANDQKKRDLAFMSSAVINLRKEPSDLPDKSCDEQRLVKVALDNALALHKQIEGIDPQVIVCCSKIVHALVQEILGTGHAYRLIQAYHPSAHMSVQEKFDLIIKSLQKTERRSVGSRFKVPNSVRNKNDA